MRTCGGIDLPHCSAALLGLNAILRGIAVRADPHIQFGAIGTVARYHRKRRISGLSRIVRAQVKTADVFPWSSPDSLLNQRQRYPVNS
jgi:hypothetical protein